jgi:hypothetical protein
MFFTDRRAFEPIDLAVKTHKTAKPKLRVAQGKNEFAIWEEAIERYV